MRLIKYISLLLVAILALNWPGQAVAEESSAHLWALAASAILAEKHHDSHELLGLGELTQENTDKQSGILQRGWGLTNREKLLKMLDWLVQEGDRREFEQIGRTIYLMDQEQIATFHNYLRPIPIIFHKVRLVRSHYLEYGRKSLKAWDFCRYIYFCRAGYACGYLTEDEAWDKIMPAARLLQRTFTGWSDLALNYQTGDWFSNVVQTPDDLNKTNTITSHLYGTAWKTNPWDTPLPESLRERLLRPWRNVTGRSLIGK